jgi:hypothetical protein
MVRFSVLMAFSLGSFAQAVPPKLFEIPLSDCSGLPCVEMRSGSGKTLRLAIDLAQANAYLDSKAAQTLGLDLKPLPGADLQQTVVPGAKLGDLPMGDFPFMVFDTTPLPADGALTYRSFQNRRVEIDFPRHIVRLSEPLSEAQPCPRECSALVIKHFGQYGPVTLTAKGFEVDGQSLDAQIDTLFTGTVLIYPASVEKLGLKKAKKEKTKDLFPFTQGGLQLVHSSTGASVGFHGALLMQNAPLYFAAPEQAFPSLQFDATVGSGLLSQAAVTFDFKGMQVWMSGTPGRTP